MQGDKVPCMVPHNKKKKVAPCLPVCRLPTPPGDVCTLRKNTSSRKVVICFGSASFFDSKEHSAAFLIFPQRIYLCSESFPGRKMTKCTGLIVGRAT